MARTQLNKTNIKTRHMLRTLNKIKCGDGLGLKGGWVPRRDVIQMCILDSGTGHHPETVSNEAERASACTVLVRLLNAVVPGWQKERGQSDASYLVSVWKMGSRESREESPTWWEEGSKGTQRVAMPCRLLWGKLPWLCSALEKGPLMSVGCCGKEGQRPLL